MHNSKSWSRHFASSSSVDTAKRGGVEHTSEYVLKVREPGTHERLLSSVGTASNVQTSAKEEVVEFGYGYLGFVSSAKGHRGRMDVLETRWDHLFG